MVAGVKGTTITALDDVLFGAPDLSDPSMIGLIHTGSTFELIDSEFVRGNFGNATATYQRLVAKIKVLTGELTGKTGYVWVSPRIEWQ